MRERTLEVLDEVDLGADAEDPLLRDGFVYEMLLAHEHQHNETMLQLLQMVDGYEPAGIRSWPPRRAARRRARDGRVDGGEHAIGAPADGFAYDNERPRHAVELAPFEIDRTPVTNGAYIRVHGGDRRRAAAVLGARRRGGLGADGDGRSRPGRSGPSRPPRLLARGRRLRPLGRQAAAERARVGGGGGRGRTRQPRPLASDAPVGARHAAVRSSATPGSGRSDFLAYPGFEAFPYREYSEVFFGDEYKVLRGGVLGDPPQRDAAAASATGTCRSAARSSPASAARGTHDPRRCRPREADDDSRSRYHRQIAIESTSPPGAARRWRATSALGLSTEPKELAPKYFYDERGSQLFEQITELPEYYPTRAERSILAERAAEIVAAAGEPRRWSSSAPARRRRPATCSSAMRDAGCLETYVPVDISEEITHETAERLVDEYPGLAIHGLVCDFEHDLERIPNGGGGG